MSPLNGQFRTVPASGFQVEWFTQRRTSNLQDWMMSREAECSNWSAQALPSTLALWEDAHSTEDLRGCETRKAWSERTWGKKYNLMYGMTISLLVCGSRGSLEFPCQEEVKSWMSGCCWYGHSRAEDPTPQTSVGLAKPSPYRSGSELVKASLGPSENLDSVCKHRCLTID